MIKIYNKSASVWTIGYEHGTAQFNPGEEVELGLDLFFEKRWWFEERKIAGDLEFTDPTAPAAPIVPSLGNTEITVDDIKTNTGDDTQPPVGDDTQSPASDQAPVVVGAEIKTEAPADPTTLTEDELARLDTMAMDELRDIAKRIGAEPARKSTELVANIKAKLAPPAGN